MNKINGDNPRNVFERIFYFYQCIKNHNIGLKVSCDIIKPKLSITNLNTFNKSPSRLLCDGLWNSIDYENLKEQLKSNFNFFDIGCGSGIYGQLLENFSGSLFKSYTGLDVYKNPRYPARFNHIKDKAENISKHINDDINFVMSQSALEHIEKDIFVLEEVTKKLIRNNKNYIQIHMVPASRCLWLYLWHGYRQYSKKNISYISYLLKEKYDLNVSIVSLGGSSSFWTHLKHITFPEYVKKFVFKKKLFKWSNQKNVEDKIVNSVNKELICDNKNPLFWAVIISSKNIKIRFKANK